MNVLAPHSRDPRTSESQLSFATPIILLMRTKQLLRTSAETGAHWKITSLAHVCRHKVSALLLNSFEGIEFHLRCRCWRPTARRRFGEICEKLQALDATPWIPIYRNTSFDEARSLKGGLAGEELRAPTRVHAL